MSCGPGAISATISLPSTLVFGRLRVVLVGAVVLPAPASVVPVVVAPHAGGVDHRNALLVRLLDQRFQIGHRHPGVLAAGVAPALDRFQDRHRPLVAERIVHVDDEQRRPLAEALARAVAGGAEHRLVAFGEKLVPDRFGHFRSLPMRMCLNASTIRCWPRLSTKLMSMISSYLTSVLRIPASITTALPVSQACGLIMPSLLHISSANERSSVALRSSSGMVGNCFLAISADACLVGVEEFQALHHAAHEALHHLRLLLDRVEADVDGRIGVGAELLRHVEERLAPDRSASRPG